MFAPHSSTQSVESGAGVTSPATTAATAVAVPCSTTIRNCSHNMRRAAMISSSETTTLSTDLSAMVDQQMSPILVAPNESAAMLSSSTDPGPPAAIA